MFGFEIPATPKPDLAEESGVSFGIEFRSCMMSISFSIRSGRYTSTIPESAPPKLLHVLRLSHICPSGEVDGPSRGPRKMRNKAELAKPKM